MNLEEAISHAIAALKAGEAGKYGYDYYAYEAACYAVRGMSAPKGRPDILAQDFVPVFEEAGWALSQRGILRPGVKHWQAQDVDGGGYSFTLSGRDALADLDETAVLLYSSGSLTQTFHEFSSRFGESFVQRASEAVKCRDCSVWLASCVMSGAAAEAVLLSIASNKIGDKEKALQVYRKANGRREILNLVTGRSPKHIKETLKDFTGIISVWRDEAGHGAATRIGAANADEALRQLLHMCQWTEKEWEALTSRSEH